jgi:putative hydrolase of HD superfamily
MLFLFGPGYLSMNKLNLERAKNLLTFLHEAEKLKCEVRHGWTSTGRQESVADHSWRLSLMVMLSFHCLDRPIDLEKALKMAIVHDIVEIITGDVPYFLAREGSDAKIAKKKEEEIAMQKMKTNLDKVFGNEIYDLWKEYEENQTYEAKVVKALDKIEAQIQQNEAAPSTWLECERDDAVNGLISKFTHFDSFLRVMSDKVVQESARVAESAFPSEMNLLSKS